METFICLSAIYLGSNSLLILFLGLFKILYGPAIGAVFAATSLIFIAALVYSARGKKLKLDASISDPFLIICSLLILLTAFFELFHAPLIFDELLYHLAIPFHFLRAHAAISIPYQMYSNFPLNTEMLYVIGLSLWNVYFARLFHFIFGVLSALTIYLIAKKHIDEHSGGIAVSIFLSMICVANLFAFAYNDLALLFYCLVSILGFLNWTDTNKPGWLVFSGVMCGLALGTKYTGGINFIILAAFTVLLPLLKRKGPGAAIASLCYFILPTLAVFSPWLVKNWIMVGNPVYPFLHNIFGGKYWDAYNTARYAFIMHDNYGPLGNGLMRYLNIPEFLTLSYKNDVPAGPILIFVLPFLFFQKWKGSKPKLLFAYMGMYSLFWLSTSMVVRFLLPALAVFAVLGSAAIRRVRWGPLFIAVFLIATCYLANKSSMYIATHSDDKELAAVIRTANMQAKRDAKVLFIGEARTYGLERDFIAPAMFDMNYSEIMMERYPDNGDLSNAIKKEGIRLLIYSPKGLAFFHDRFGYFRNARNFTRAREFANSSFLTLIAQSGGFYLFLIK